MKERNKKALCLLSFLLLLTMMLSPIGISSVYAGGEEYDGRVNFQEQDPDSNGHVPVKITSSGSGFTVGDFIVYAVGDASFVLPPQDP